VNRVHYFEEELKLSKLCELQFSSDQISQLILAGLRKDVKNITVHKVGLSLSLEVLKKCLHGFEQNKTFIETTSNVAVKAKESTLTSSKEVTTFLSKSNL